MMKKDQPPPNEHSSPPSEKSFSTAFEQMAKLLRSEVKMKDRSTKVLSSTALPTSFGNSLKQIAKLLRSEIHPSTPPKKRIWKKQPSRNQKLTIKKK